MKSRCGGSRFSQAPGGGEHWAVIASLIETCKLNNVDPHAYLNETITLIVNGHLNSRLDELMPGIINLLSRATLWPNNTAYYRIHESKTRRVVSDKSITCVYI
ncbi:hypothetical protein GCM10007874_58700 [Labrys miyagiensis]|uniref:Transposase IS66 C-terminal domain-containing protein n=1 Tax=Labrys miyagiensis TaxID=346912 RepID=A0ABQ6CRV0_9HYPH|nr:hypothetical protein GCM10007874_58700 [Labrys miyagiensis]